MLKELKSDCMGLKAVDTLSGYEGTITGHCIHATGCDQICLGGGLDKDGKPREGQWFDINRIRIVSEAPVWTPGQATKPGACCTPPRSM